MFSLDLLYSYYLCQLSLDKNSQLSSLYYQANMENDICLNFNYYDHGLEKFLLELVEKRDKCSDIEMTNRTDSFVANYNRLPDLIVYMHKVYHLKRSHEQMLESTYLKYPLLQDCFLPDARLKDLFFDNRNHLCIMNLSNVTLYNSMRKNKNIPVDSGDITLLFKNVQKVKMKGELNLDCYDANKIYASHIMKTEDDLISFSVFILVVNRCFMLELICSDLDVKLKV